MMILVLGGTKSGKSSFASRRAAERKALGPVTYLATALAGDAEMVDRISRHQADRPSDWITVEEPENPAAYFSSLTSEPAKEHPSTVLLDCITLWLTNILAPLGDKPERTKALEMGQKKIVELTDAIMQWEQSAPGLHEAILVSNQVETGLISPWPLGRIFQDIAGLGHQALAAVADEVYLMSAGLPQKLK